MSFLTYLQSKPDHVRTRYVFIGAVLVTAIIGGVWSTTLPTRLRSISGMAEESIKVAKNSTSPIDITKTNVANVIESATEDALRKAHEAEEAAQDPYGTLSGSLFEDPYKKLSATTTSATNTIPVEPDIIAEDVLLPATSSPILTNPVQQTQSNRIILIGTTTSKIVE